MYTYVKFSFGRVDRVDTGVHFAGFQFDLLLGWSPMEQISNDSGWRGSPEGWLEAAYDLLLESGVDTVRISPLAKKLGLSRTSFYWFFRDREELLAGLVTRWRDKNTGNLVKQAEAYAETVAEAMLNVFDCWLDKSMFDAQFEFAVRSWAIQSPDILAEVQKADQTRLYAMSQMFVRFGYKESLADVRARTVYLVQIGYISMQTREDLTARMKRIPGYVEIFIGEAPQQRELDRFFARHDYLAD
ncbi:TetR family transcriptional regulator [Mesorhizobium sp. LNJC405B00]|nr:TetR family transcriptional regulator [Mesorhizobium sp. LNJC405B00]